MLVSESAASSARTSSRFVSKITDSTICPFESRISTSSASQLMLHPAEISSSYRSLLERRAQTGFLLRGKESQPPDLVLWKRFTFVSG
jgi:hypothetical protein